MDPAPFVTINSNTMSTSRGTTPELPFLPFQPLSPLDLMTPMLLTTDSNGMQTLSPLPMLPLVLPQVAAFQAVDLPPLPTLTSSQSRETPSSLELPPSPMLTSWHSCSSPSALELPPLPVLASSSSSQSPQSSPRLEALPVSRERGISREFDMFEIESKEPVKNERAVPVPQFTDEMTKKDLVNLTLDWLYDVCGSRFDCRGLRGRNVVRIKVKTRGALEYICILVQRCIDEELISHVSCPISTKKRKKHIRGYLTYLEAVSEEATARTIDIFNELNTAFVENCDGEMEHPFKGISRNTIPTRANEVAA